MKFINVITIILLMSILLVSCGRPGGKGDENAPGSYLQVTKVGLSGDTATVTIKNIFKDPSVTPPTTGSMYDVTLTSYTINYFNVNGTVIASKTNNNVLFIFISVGGTSDPVSITLDPRPSSVSFSSAQMHIFGKNGFGDNIGVTFNLPTSGSGGSMPPAPGSAPTISSINPTSGARGTNPNITISGTNFVSGATVTFTTTGGTGITVGTFTVGSSTNITGSITIDATATTGSWTVTVKNPDGQSATVSFTVT